MREEVRDVERLRHMLEAINVLITYKNKHSFEEATADPVTYFGLVKQYINLQKNFVLRILT